MGGEREGDAIYPIRLHETAYMIENDDYDAIDGFHSLYTKEVCKIH